LFFLRVDFQDLEQGDIAGFQNFSRISSAAQRAFSGVSSPL